MKKLNYRVSLENKKQIFKKQNFKNIKFNSLVKKITNNDPENNTEKEYLFFHKNRYKKIINYVNKNNNKNIKILDIGCGYAHILKFCHLIGFKNINGTDTIDNIYEKNKYNIKFKINNIDKEILPFNDNTFDLIIFSEVLEHFNFYPLKVFDELFRVLNNSGEILLTTPNLTRLNNRIKFSLGKSTNYDISLNSDNGAHYREYTGKEIKYLANRAGFKNIKIKYKYFKYPDTNYIINLTNKITTYFFASLRSNLMITIKK